MPLLHELHTGLVRRSAASPSVSALYTTRAAMAPLLRWQPYTKLIKNSARQIVLKKIMKVRVQLTPDIDPLNDQRVACPMTGKLAQPLAMSDDIGSHGCNYIDTIKYRYLKTPIKVS